ncbi:MAG TPA: hypothetical protein VNK49_04455 [Anaerolineales bacterium]|nr:hypothetical protein [Anaerolineales bacterium]
MNLRDLVRRIRNSLKPHESLSDEVVLGFLRILEQTSSEELTCDEIYQKLDEYVERQVSCKDAALLMPLIREHLDACHECWEEYEALLDVIEKSQKT